MSTYRVDVISKSQVIDSRSFTPRNNGAIADSYQNLEANTWMRTQMEQAGVDETRLYQDGQLAKTWTGGEQFRDAQSREQKLNWIFDNCPEIRQALLAGKMSPDQALEMAG